ncbi:MAG: hypothetical protein KC502_07750 [Myxococcales bacterium]|nr:hypothetical protein [Myxococcales bacterium]
MGRRNGRHPMESCVVLSVCAVSLLLTGCGGAAPIYPTTPDEVALLQPASSGHFLPPQRRYVHPALRQRIGRSRRPAGPARARRTPRPRRSTQLQRKRHKRSDSQAKSRQTRSRIPSRQTALLGQQRVEAATELLGTAGLKERAFVDHVLHAVGAPISVARQRPYAGALWHSLRNRRVRQPRPGDLVFFRNTMDLNGNGRPDDGVTWVAVVERVDGRRVLFVGQRAGKVRRMSLSRSRPRVVRTDGQVLNTRLVQWPRESRPRTAGQCFAGFARP